MEWMVEEMVEMDIDWCVVVESKEHAYLADLMESLKMGCGPVLHFENVPGHEASETKMCLAI
jgi:hypothetical protein